MFPVHPPSGNPFWGRNQLEHRNRRRICLLWMLFAISRQHPALSRITLIRVTTWSRWTRLSAISSRLLHRNRRYRHRHGEKCATWATRKSCRRTRGLPPAPRKAGTRRLHYWSSRTSAPFFAAAIADANMTLSFPEEEEQDQELGLACRAPPKEAPRPYIPVLKSLETNIRHLQKSCNAQRVKS